MHLIVNWLFFYILYDLESIISTFGEVIGFIILFTFRLIEKIEVYSI